MANCTLNKNLLRGSQCDYSLPEVKDIYLADYASVNATRSYSCDSAGTEVTAIASGVTFYHIEPAKNSVTFTDELVVEDNGNKYRTHTLTFNVIGKYDKDMVCVLDGLSLGRYIAVVVTADGQWLMLGAGAGLEATAATNQGGGDTNGMTITLAANVTESATPLSETAIATVKGE